MALKVSIFKKDSHGPYRQEATWSPQLVWKDSGGPWLTALGAENCKDLRTECGLETGDWFSSDSSWLTGQTILNEWQQILAGKSDKFSLLSENLY